ncbi:MAG: type II toxin-antitoxin system HicA family toxin [Candidatus Promineofilum sp.]|nr:type II toxin-antitoxin system HicA family toxin [Promineifilum sp.]MCW5863417.1 type II toxin-antitoxin system HicA family toxin [Anaerolineae bacterium]
MPKLPVISGRELIAALQKAGFEAVRQRGSHIRLRHEDGRVVTVAVHTGDEIGRGLLRKILRDADMSVDELIALLK